MEKINIETTQNVAIEFPLASLVDRIAAFFIDLLILIIYSIVLFSTLSDVLFDSFILFLFLYALPTALYSLLLEIFLQGRTLGKMALNIKVISLDGKSPTVGQYILRWLIAIVDIWIFTGLPAIIAIIATGKGQRIGDIAAGTCVIKTTIRESLQNTALSDIYTNYTVKYPEANNLSDEDINTIKDLLMANRQLNVPDNIIQANERAKLLIENKLGIKSSEHPLTFFKILLIDFNYINGKIQ